ncbi:hypothetical protein GDO81_022168 [Engystomops pustulosus]|uniref:Nuclear factor of kappa light polypeptide gene enhancer in B-cells inhibitor, epsilon n=1 Tax=Engystomops pustulosus TaxID=76066 RepID=A0AAV6YNB0_ENGPU|nr:hypothetical protein GDO81_022168 [Engystomops pustulosus]
MMNVMRKVTRLRDVQAGRLVRSALYCEDVYMDGLLRSEPCQHLPSCLLVESCGEAAARCLVCRWRPLLLCMVITCLVCTCSLLHLSIIHGIPDLSLYFISLAPRDVLDIQNDLYQSALHLAVYLGQEEIVEALVQKDVNLELQDRKGDTALHLACEKEHLDCAQILLRGPRGPQNLQLQNWKGLSCLHIATLKRNPALISLLLESGADINSQEGTSGKTPLHLAVEMLDPSLLQHLLQHRPRVDAFMYNGCTPLHLAVGRKDAGLARILCQAGADILQRNREGDTPQDLAEGNNQLLALLPFDDLKISGKPVVTSA